MNGGGCRLSESGFTGLRDSQDITRQGEAPTPAHRKTEKQQGGRAKEFRVADTGTESDAPPNWDTH